MNRTLLASVLLAGCTLMVDPSELEPGAPPVPTGVVAVAGNALATVYWDALDADVASWEIYAGATSGALTLVAQESAGASQSEVTGLVNGTLYYFAVRAIDSVGTASALSDEASAMPFLPDTTPPTLSGSIPADGATGVAVDATITLTFSEPMDVGTVEVDVTPSVSLGAPAWNETATELVFTPDPGLDPETQYDLTVTGTDSAGNPLAGGTGFAFNTVGVPPTVQSNTPSSGATGVPSSTAIQFVFSEAMAKATVQAAFSSSPAITCTWSWLGGDTLATCTPGAALTASTTYTVTLGTGATDVAGTHLEAPHVFGFTTAAAPDTTKPTVASTSPANGATGAPLATNISVTFSEAVDKASAQAAFQILSPSGHGVGVFTWSADGLTMTYNPDTSFAYGDYVSCRVSTAVKDLAGNYMAANHDFAFRAVRQGTKTIYSTASLDGYLWSSTTTAYTTATYFYTGDNSINAYSRSFVSFDLLQLPTTTTAITAATLYLYQESLSGAPYSTLGYLYAERVDYGASLDTTDMTLAPERHVTGFSCVPLPCHAVYADDRYTLSTTTTSGWKSATVTTSAANAWADRATDGGRCQFRMRFGSTTDSDSVTDWAVLTSGDAASNKPYLYVTYEYP